MCRERRAGAKAHIIPKGFYRMIDPNFDEQIRVYTTDIDDRSPLRRTGAVDTSILCRECEQRFQVCDDHAVKALSENPVPNMKWGHDKIHELRGFRAEKLKLAFMHILWRANESKLPDFDAIDLDGDGDRLRAFLWSDNAGSPADFAVILALHPPDPDKHYLISPPYPHGKWENGARYLQMTIVRSVVFITTSSIGLPSEYAPYALATGAPIPVVLLPIGWRDSWTGQLLKETSVRRMTRGSGGPRS